jgi:hypothetical protein
MRIVSPSGRWHLGTWAMGQFGDLAIEQFGNKAVGQLGK